MSTALTGLPDGEDVQCEEREILDVGMNNRELVTPLWSGAGEDKVWRMESRQGTNTAMLEVPVRPPRRDSKWAVKHRNLILGRNPE